MEIHRGDLSSLPRLKPTIGLTIGNFDGVHLGHQYLIKQLQSKLEGSATETAVLCFDPHPEKVLGKGVEELTGFDQKAQLLSGLGVNHLVVQDFDTRFSKVTAEDFLRQYLHSFFNLSHLVVGYDFRFGVGGEGDFSLMESFFSPMGVTVEKEVPFTLGGTTLSSSLIREKLRDGLVDEAEKYLGRPYSVKGEVIEGVQLGRQLGFPTANLGEILTLVPGNGVYICEVEIQGSLFPAVCNIGHRPTLGVNNKNLEVHVLSYSEDLYGHVLEVSFVKKIRNEQKFENLDMLKLQIEKDVAQAGEYFDSRKA